MRVVADPDALDRRFDAAPDPIGQGKRELVLAPNRGRFVRKCPGTMGLVCCNYWVIDLAEGCSLDCSYCVLQGYLNDRRIRLATNIGDLVDQIDAELARWSGPARFGTGELSDSLMFDPALGLGAELVEIFRARPRATLELKTKTDNIGGVITAPPASNVVLAWSLNRPSVIASDEKGAAGLDARLAAARKAVEAGWKVAFHFDPLTLGPGWEEEYSDVVNRMFDAASPDNVAWISLGALRFHPSMKKIIKRRHGESGILGAEFVLCPDAKMRYAKPLRRELFRKMKSFIDARAPSAPVYLCMEGIEMWNAVFGHGPARACALESVFG